MEVYYENKVVRYRTEAFSGLGERNAAEVMAFETFELGNSDILEYLAGGLLAGNYELKERCFDFIDDDGGVVTYPLDDGVSFFEEVLSEVKKITGLDIRYALWLADKETVTDKEWYGRDMADDEDFESYQVGPVVLSELGYDGTLYGYEQMPFSLETRLEYAEDDLVNIINEREGARDGTKRAEHLDVLYCEKDNEIQKLKEVIGQKMSTGLDAKLQDAVEQTIGQTNDTITMGDFIKYI